MSDVLRRAIIELEIRTKRGGANADTSQLAKAYDQQEQAAKKVEAQTAKTSQANKQYAATSGQTAAQVASHSEQMARSHEEFGARSFRSMSHAAHGVIDLTRGLALMAASGTEDTKKLVEQLFLIEGAVSATKGAARLAHFAEAAGIATTTTVGLGAAVAAGAYAMNSYATSIEKAKEQERQLTEAHRTAIERGERLKETMAGIAAKSAAARTDSVLNPDEAERRRRGELSDIASRRGQRATEIGDLEQGAQRARQRQAQLEGQAGKYTTAGRNAQIRKLVDGGMSVEDAMRAVPDRTQLDEQAKATGKGYEDIRKSQLGLIGQDTEDLNRQGDIQRARINDRISGFDQQRGEALGGAMRLSKRQEESLKYGDPRDRMQRQDSYELANQAYAQTARMFGAPLFTQNEVNQTFGTATKKAQDELKELLDLIHDAVESNKKRFEELKTDLDGAAAAK